MSNVGVVEDCKAILDKNLKTISQSNRHFISPFDASKLKYNLWYGDKEVTITHEEKSICYNNFDLHSSDIDFNHPSIYLITGILDVGMIQHICKNASSSSAILIVEPNPEVFHFVISHYDLSAVFNDSRVFLIVADYNAANALFAEDYLIKKGIVRLASNVQFYTSKYIKEFESLPAFKMQKRFLESIKIVLFMMGNDPGDTLIGLLQNLLNLEKFCYSTSIKEFKSRYSGVPAVIVSAGPSLEKNVHYLKEFCENVLVFAVDTVMSKLLKMGIMPDAVFTIERPKIVYEYFYQDADIPEDTVFVGPPVVYPKILEKFKTNRMLLPLKYNETVNKWINSLVDDRGDFIPCGASVAHLAFSFARYLGCDPIIFIGQDLAYGEDGRTHVKDTVYDSDSLPSDKQKKKEEELMVEGYFGKPVRTKRIWRDFQLWFESEFYKTNQTVINATEGGVKLLHTVQMPFKEALSKYAVKQKQHICTALDEVYKPLYLDFDAITAKIQDEIKKLKNFNRIVSDMSAKLERMKPKVNNTNRKQYLKKTIDFNNKYVKHLSKLAFFSLFIQMHNTICNVMYTRLPVENTPDKIKQTMDIQMYLYTSARDLSKIVADELERFLNTSWEKGKRLKDKGV